MILLKVSGLAKSVYYYTLSKIDKDGKNKELLNKQLQLLAEKSLNADADTLVNLTDAMCKVYKVLNGDL